MSRDEVLELLQSTLTSQIEMSVARQILDIYLEDAEIVEKDRKVSALLNMPIVAGDCIHYAIDALCRKFDIVKVLKEDTIVLYL